MQAEFVTYADLIVKPRLLQWKVSIRLESTLYVKFNMARRSPLIIIQSQENKEEYEVSVCLCGSQVCRMSYLNLTGGVAFQKVLKGCHGILDRYQLMFKARELNMVSEEVYIDLRITREGSGTD